MRIVHYLKVFSKYCLDRDYRFLINASLGKYNKWPDSVYLKKMFQVKMHKELNLDNPQTFNEKLQWLKLHDRKPEYTIMVDKYKVRDYIAEKIGPEYLIPLLGVWDNPDEIDFDALPNQFVLKCNHNSGLGMCICKDKSKLDIDLVKRGLKKGLEQDYYSTSREWPYKNVPRKIICEKYMMDHTNLEEYDYQFSCFGGLLRCHKSDFDKFFADKADYFISDGELVCKNDITCLPNFEKEMTAYPSFDATRDLDDKLMGNNPILCTDFYDMDEKYVGKLFFCNEKESYTHKDNEYQYGFWLNVSEMSGGGYALFCKGLMCFLVLSDKVIGLTDYKFFCFNGEPKFLYVATGSIGENEKETFLDVNWDYTSFKRIDYPEHSVKPCKPIMFNKMVDFSKILSKDIPFLRVDFYEIERALYCGELTFTPGAGFIHFTPPEKDTELGRMIPI